MVPGPTSKVQQNPLVSGVFAYVGLTRNLRWFVTKAFVIVALVFVAGCSGVPANPVAPSLTPSRLTLTVSPPTVLLSGSTAVVRARLVDASGSGVSGERLRFVTNAGSLSALEGITSTNGEVQITLTASTPATVSATAPAGIAQVNASVDAVAPFTLELAAAAGAIVDDAPIDVIVRQTTVVAAPGPQTLTVRCGSAANSVTVPGGTGTIPVRCRFGSPGTFDVVASGSTANGWTTTSAPLRVTVGTRPVAPMNLRLTITAPGPKQPDADQSRPVTITAIVTPDFRLADTYDFDFGDGVQTGPLNQFVQTHFYKHSGTYTIRVTVRTTDGRSITESGTVVVDLT